MPKSQERLECVLWVHRSVAAQADRLVEAGKPVSSPPLLLNWVTFHTGHIAAIRVDNLDGKPVLLFTCEKDDKLLYHEVLDSYDCSIVYEDDECSLLFQVDVGDSEEEHEDGDCEGDS